MSRHNSCVYSRVYISYRLSAAELAAKQIQSSTIHTISSSSSTGGSGGGGGYSYNIELGSGAGQGHGYSQSGAQSMSMKQTKTVSSSSESTLGDSLIACELICHQLKL